jgi:TetR/AcrR family tetracycline transcriptional repressor
MSTAPGLRSPQQDERAREIVATALHLVDQGGLENLTMRKLAEALGVKLPIIYRLFTNKQELVNNMADTLLGKAVYPDAAAGWEEQTIAMARALRLAILGQRDGARIVGGSYSALSNTFSFADRLIEVMRQAGLTGAAAMWSTTTVFCYVLGETLEQQGADDISVDHLDPALATRYPQLFSTPIESFVEFDDRFDYGMSIIVAGLKSVGSR